MDNQKFVNWTWAMVVMVSVIGMCGWGIHACDTNRDVMKACLATHPALECKQLDQGH